MSEEENLTLEDRMDLILTYTETRQGKVPDLLKPEYQGALTEARNRGYLTKSYEITPAGDEFIARRRQSL